MCRINCNWKIKKRKMWKLKLDFRWIFATACYCEPYLDPYLNKNKIMRPSGIFKHGLDISWH